MQLKKPTRLHRIDRDGAKLHIEDDTGHLWAVSYADFLMVLLSFFILFFSVGKNDKDAIVNIISKVKEQGLGRGEGGGGNSLKDSLAASSERVADPKSIVAVIGKDLKDIRYELNEKTKTVTFVLADDIYRVGRVRPSEDGEKSLRELLHLLKPFGPEIDLVFVGHTDSRPVRTRRVPGVNNNFDLSALRASYAVQLAMGEGLPKEGLYTHGSADNTRVSKSLSIIVKPRGAGQI